MILKIKEVILFTIILLLYLYIIFYKDIITYNLINISLVWLKDIVPILFPSFILCDLLLSSNIPYYINKYLHINYIYIISIIIGSPSNAYIINNYDNKIDYLSVTSYVSFCYLYIMLNRLFEFKYVLILILLNIFCNFILIWIIKPSRINTRKKSFNLLLSIKNSVNILITILGTLIFFNILPLFFIDNKYIIGFIYSILDVSSSFNYLISNDFSLFIKLIYSSISISTCGLCICNQIKSIISDTSFNKYYLYRFIHLIIYLSLVLCCYIIFK